MRKRVSAASTFGLVLLRADGTVDASIGFGRCAHLGSSGIPRGFSPIALRVKRIGQDLHAFGQFFRRFRGRVQSFLRSSPRDSLGSWIGSLTRRRRLRARA